MHPNEVVTRRFLQALWNDRDESVLDGMTITQGGRARGIKDETKKGMNKKEYLEFFRMMTAAFPDLQMTIDESIGDDRRVALRLHLTMTHLGTFLEIPATGRTVTVTGMAFCWFRGSRGTGSLSQWDLAGLLQQLGALSLPPVRPAEGTARPGSAQPRRRTRRPRRKS